MNSVTRSRLLAGATFLGASTFIPQQAMAQCVLTAGNVTCATTTTTDTTNAGATSATDRHYPVDTSAAGFTGTISTGATVNGFGLAFTNTTGGANTLNVVNNGTVQVNGGNTPTAGGNGALDITAIGATNVTYGGTGDVTNLGTGAGLRIDAVDGSITGTTSGDLTSASDVGLDLRSSGTGAINFTSTGLVTSGSVSAVQANVSSNTGGDLTLNLGDVTSSNNFYAIFAQSQSGTGNLNVTTNGDVTGGAAYLLSINSATATGDINVTSNGAIIGDDLGMDVDNFGTGDVTITTVGPVTTTNGYGIDASSSGGNITVQAGDVTAGSEFAIRAVQNDTAATGNVTVNTTGNIAGATDAIIINDAGTGAITVNATGSIAADAGDAIRVTSTNAAGGTIGITTTAGETIAASGGDGIDVDTAGTGTVTVTNAASIISGTDGVGTLQDGINVSSTGSGGITINNTGAIGATGDQAQGAGITATMTDATSGGNISITGTGGIFSLGDGIDASTTGTGTIGVVYGGNITSDGLRAISAVGTTGAVTITTAGTITATADGSAGLYGTTTTGALNITANGDVTAPGLDTAGINANSTSGNQTIAINGDVSGSTALVTSTTGTRAITVGTGGSLNGVNEALLIQGTGAATLTNAGTIGTLATDSAILVTDDADTTITNQTGGVINGDITLGLADDTITNAGTINAGSLDFGGGADLLTNQAGGTLTVAGATPILGLETLNNAGTINAATGLTFDAGATALTNTGTLNTQGIIDFGDGADTFANSGAGIINVNANTTLTGLETFTNTGRINLNTFTLTGTGVAFNNTGFLDTNGNTTLAGFTTFSNAGTLDLAAGTLTVPAAVFTNTGTILADEGAATITGQTSFANSGTIDLQDGAVGDVLTINSAFAGSGGSNLLIDFNDTAADRLVIAGAASGTTTVNANFLGGGLINLDGVLVADTTSTSANAFVLGTVGGDTPLVDFSLVQNGADFFLVSAPNEAAFNPLVVPGFANDLWYQSANEVFAETRKPASTTGASFWGDVYISRDRFGDDGGTVDVGGVEFDVDRELKTRRRGIQGGVDFGFAGGGRVGLTGGYARAKANGSAGADLKARGWNLGVYGQFGGLTGFHAEFLAKHDRYKGEFDDGAFDGERFKIRANGIDGSFGYRFGMAETATVDLHAGLSHVRTKVDDISAFGFTYDLGKMTSTRGRAGVRATFGGGLAPYIDATVHREFNGDGDIELFDGGDNFDLGTNGKATWVRVEAGLSGNDGPGPILAAWGDLGDRKGLGLRAGYRFGGRVAPAIVPAPAYVAPPAPPAPATQTCPDGSVVLATDVCPAAPEPVAPPPPPEAQPERG